MGRLARKSLWLVLGRAVADGLSFLYYLLLARAYGADGIGAYSFAFAVAALVGLGVNLGLGHLLTRAAARDPGLVRRAAVSVTAVQAVLAVLLGILIALGESVYGLPAGTRTLLLLAFASTALHEMALSFVSYVEGGEAMGTSALLTVASRAVLFLLVVGLLVAGATLTHVLWAHVIAHAVYLAAAIAATRRLYGPLRSPLDPALALRQVRASLPFLAAGALYALYARVDIIMLHHFRGEVETGFYSAAQKLASTPIFVAFLIGTAVFPALSRTGPEDPAARDDLFREAVRWIALIGLTGAVLLASVGDRAAIFLYGSGFAAAGEVVRWMAAIYLAECIAVPYWRLLYAIDRERLVLWMRAAAVGMNVLLNLFLIPRWGPVGAVWASTVSEGGLALGLHVVCARVVPAPLSGLGLRLALVAVGSLAVLIPLRWSVPWPILVLVGGGLILGLSLAVHVIRRDDLHMLVRTVTQGLPSAEKRGG